MEFLLILMQRLMSKYAIKVSRLFPAVLGMGVVIFVSNKLVQHPVQGFIFGIDLSLILTWGAFTYPVAFLITDTTNRIFGVSPARRVVAVGFALGVGLTIVAALGIASGVSRVTELSDLAGAFLRPRCFGDAEDRCRVGQRIFGGSIT